MRYYGRRFKDIDFHCFRRVVWFGNPTGMGVISKFPFWHEDCPSELRLATMLEF